MTRKRLSWVIPGLIALNGLLFLSVREAEAASYFFTFKTCSIEVSTKECLCDMTILQECDPDGDPGEYCEVQCVLET